AEDQEAQTVQFVERMTKVLIDQLLDDLLADGVLNDGEKDWVLEENRSTADKARCLFDMVKKKGVIAMNSMSDHLRHRDPVLYDSLVPAR
uniref:CARD domain-containing protein n=1 Tax=Mastacembelus armatus TaxID=205130 RepID=A0A3Q3S660_9TELE